jgi:tetratricopeptide (TPR) repeat protein
MAERSGGDPLLRTVRVFVSSTFRDMHAEREQLAKHVFPALRKRCEARGVVWGDVDLRWGITAEAAAEGKVLPICLEEIRSCRPYFIGVLGERYGWVPRQIPESLIETQPWLRDHRERSVTELEILHGVLTDPEMAEHAFFYFRDPAYIDRLPDSVSRDDFRSEDPEAERKLKALKDRIRATGFPVREGYADPRAFGSLVLEDLGGVIDRLFPEGSQPDALDRDAWEHEAFARSRAAIETPPGERAGAYVGRQEYFDRLNQHAAGNGPPLVVLGESGSGKSALLANWALAYRNGHSDELLLLHFIGATPASADWAAMLRRILCEFNRRLQLRIEVPDNPEALGAAFANALWRAAAKGRVILVLDALNQLEDRDQAPDLVWLPREIPESVRLVVSTLPGRSLDDLVKRGWPAMTVLPLVPEERRELIVQYLRQYRKELSAQRIAHLSAAPQTANPLFLRALLEELRLWGVHETLDQCIDGYLSAETLNDLYERILARFEKDYESDRPELVRDAMSLLWAARRGLSETELLELLGEDETTPLPRAHWSPLHLAAELSLTTRSGLVGFFHDHMRQAVERRYLPTEDARCKAHLRVADYFARRELGPRQIDELPWQLRKADEWKRLGNLLTDTVFLDSARRRLGHWEVCEMWAELEARSVLSRRDAYAGAVESLTTPVYLAEAVAAVLYTGGMHVETLRIRGRLVEHYSRLGDLANLQVALGNQALSLRVLGETRNAAELIRMQVGLARNQEDESALQLALGNLGFSLRQIGDLGPAAECFAEQEAIAARNRWTGPLAHALSGQGLVAKDRGDLLGAEALYQKAQVEAQRSGDRLLSAQVYGFQAEIRRHLRDYDEAAHLHALQESIASAIGDIGELGQAWIGLGLVAVMTGRPDEARSYWTRARDQAEATGNVAQQANSFANLGALEVASGNLGDAWNCFKLAAVRWRQIRNPSGLAIALANQALVLVRDSGRVSESDDPDEELWKLSEEAYRLARRHGLARVQQQFSGLFASVRAQLDPSDPDR